MTSSPLASGSSWRAGLGLKNNGYSVPITMFWRGAKALQRAFPELPTPTAWDLAVCTAAV